MELRNNFLVREIPFISLPAVKASKVVENSLTLDLELIQNRVWIAAINIFVGLSVLFATVVNPMTWSLLSLTCFASIVCLTIPLANLVRSIEINKANNYIKKNLNQL